MIGAVLDSDGRPICCELWPGNTADVTTLLAVVDRLRQRFGIRKACIVADRGMICDDAVQELEATGWPYILRVRMRQQKEVREQVLALEICGLQAKPETFLGPEYAAQRPSSG